MEPSFSGPLSAEAQLQQQQGGTGAKQMGLTVINTMSLRALLVTLCACTKVLFTPTFLILSLSHRVSHNPGYL